MKQYIYFLKESAFGAIKIGFAHNVPKRMKQIQTNMPQTLEFMGVIEGGVKKEKILHDQFSHLKIHGEWFRSDEDLLDFIKNQSSPDIPVLDAKPKQKRTRRKIPMNFSSNRIVLKF